MSVESGSEFSTITGSLLQAVNIQSYTYMNDDHMLMYDEVPFRLKEQKYNTKLLRTSPTAKDKGH